jgi:hypothetical protein
VWRENWVMWLIIRTSMVFCEHGKLNATSGFKKSEAFLDKLSYCDLLKKDSAQQS